MWRRYLQFWQSVVPSKFIVMQREELRREFLDVLHHNILSFWSERMVDQERGGFYGRIDGRGVVDLQAPKGAILNARILWAFSAAYRTLGGVSYLEMATRAKEYFVEHFIDREYGGVYWSLTPQGAPLDTKKQIYALGFAIYGLSEYYRATGDEGALAEALSLYNSIEEHSFDSERNGYFEAFTREWAEIGDMRLSARDANECKTMNTHLHILEPYTNLYRACPSEPLRTKLTNLVEIFLDKIYNPRTGHLGLFFNEEWESRDEGYSYGHDIEASWLLLEAALEVGDDEFVARVESVAQRIAAAADEGLRGDGSMVYERRADGDLDEDRHWWVQAENVIGHLWLDAHHLQDGAYQKAVNGWNYIKHQLLSSEGEWYWSRRSTGEINQEDDMAGFWKCPYHNSRMALFFEE